MKIDHFYIKVDNLDEAIDFYEKLLGMEIAHREGDRWADFQKEDEVYFGIFNAAHDNEIPVCGNNITLSLKSENINEDYKRVKRLYPKSITNIIIIKQPSMYRYFQFEDPWQNVWEVAEYSC